MWTWFGGKASGLEERSCPDGEGSEHPNNVDRQKYYDAGHNLRLLDRNKARGRVLAENYRKNFSSQELSYIRNQWAGGIARPTRSIASRGGGRLRWPAPAFCKASARRLASLWAAMPAVGIAAPTSASGPGSGLICVAGVWLEVWGVTTVGPRHRSLRKAFGAPALS